MTAPPGSLVSASFLPAFRIPRFPHLFDPFSFPIRVWLDPLPLLGQLSSSLPVGRLVVSGDFRGVRFVRYLKEL